MKHYVVLSMIVLFVLAIGTTSVFAGSVNVTGTLSPGGPQLPQVAIISTPDCTGAYNVFPVLYAAYSFTVDVGGVYTFTEPGIESAVYVYEGNFNPNLPADNCIAASNINPLNFTETLTAGTLYYVAIIDDTFVQDGLSYDIGISGPGNITNCLFNDDFSDGILDWFVVKPSVTETGGNLVLTPAARKAEAVAAPLFGGCTNCTLNASVQTAGGPLNKVWVLGWYTDKRNTIELLFKEESDKVVLKQRSNGRVVAKKKAAVTINPNTAYNVLIDFNGTQFTVSIDGNPLILMSPVGLPSGVPGFRAKNTTATAHVVCVN